MRKRCVFVWAMTIFVFLSVMWDAADARNNNTTEQKDHAASITTNGTDLFENDKSTLTTSNYGSYGVSISGNGSSWIFNDDVIIKTRGYNSYAAFISGSNSSLFFNAGAEITTDSTNAYGIYIGGNNSTGTLKKDVTIKTGGERASAAFVDGKNSSLFFDAGTKITTSGKSAHGVLLSGDHTTIEFGERAVITIEGRYAEGASTGYYTTGAKIIFGDNAKFVIDKGTGVAADGNNSSIILGNDTHFVSKGSNAVTAGRTGKVILGDRTDISFRSSGGGRAVGAFGSSSIIFGDDTNINSSGIDTTSVLANDADSRVDFGNKTRLTTEGEGAWAIYAQGNNAQVTFKDNAIITTSGKKAHAIQTYGKGSLVEFGRDTKITTSGLFAHLAWALGGASEITFGDDATLTSEGSGGYSAWAYGADSQINFGSGTKITSLKSGSYGAYAYGTNSKITFVNDTYITTGGTNAYGVVASGSNSSINFGVGTTIETSGYKAHGAQISTNGSDMVSSINFGDGTSITTKGEAAYGTHITRSNSQMNFGDGTSVTTNGANSYGAYITGVNSSMNFGGIASVNTVRGEAHGVMVTGAGSSVVFSGDTSISTSGNGAHGAVVGDHSINVEFKGGATISTSGADSYALFAKLGKISSGQSGKYTIDGDMAADAGTIDLKMAYGSRFTGNTDTNSGNISLAMTDSRWNVTKDSNLTSLRLDSSVVDYRNTAPSTTITTKVLDGSGGTFLMKTDIEGKTGDKLVVTEGMNGSRHGITVFNNGSAATKGDEIITLVDTIDPSGSFQLTNVVELGIWQYGLRQVDGGLRSEWQLYASGPSGSTKPSSPSGSTEPSSPSTSTEPSSPSTSTEPSSPSGSTEPSSPSTSTEPSSPSTSTEPSSPSTSTEPSSPSTSTEPSSTGDLSDRINPGGNGSKTLTSTADAAINTIYAAYLLSYAETQTLIQRLGDLRESPHLNGFWFKGLGSSFESKPKQLTKPFDMDYWGIQLGYDRQVEINWDGDLYAGVMFGYSKGDLDFSHSGGSGDVDSKTVGVYGTYIHPNGFFADLVLKYQWMDSDFDTIDSAARPINGNDASSNGFGASLELGQRIPFGNKQKSGWYVEPQVQMSLQRLGGGYFNASNGLHIGAEEYTSWLGRLGGLVGYETEKTNFYAKASAVREFGGDINIFANSMPIDMSIKSNWWVYGLGFTSRINDTNSIYVDIERSSGGLFTQKWAIQAGWRIEF